VKRPTHLAGLLCFAALASCGGAPVKQVDPLPAAGPVAVRMPVRPVCAVTPQGVTPASPSPVPPPPAGGPRPEVLLSRARTLRSEGDHVGARSRLEQAALLAPDDPEVCFELADLLVANAAELDRAGDMLLAIPASHRRRDGTLGRLAELRGDPLTAEAAYGRQLALADDPGIRLRRALVLERLGRDAEAIIELERVQVAEPANAVVRARLAERYEAVGRLAEAELELRAIADASPGRPEGWRRLAAFCARHGLAERARSAEARAGEAESRPHRDLRPLRPTGR
jgi:tetratricopeptide (TPR) repeat protein